VVIAIENVEKKKCRLFYIKMIDIHVLAPNGSLRYGFNASTSSA
jgi:hypothetical protein